MAHLSEEDMSETGKEEAAGEVSRCFENISRPVPLALPGYERVVASLCCFQLKGSIGCGAHSRLRAGLSEWRLKSLTIAVAATSNELFVLKVQYCCERFVFRILSLP